MGKDSYSSGGACCTARSQAQNLVTRFDSRMPPRCLVVQRAMASLALLAQTPVRFGLVWSCCNPARSKKIKRVDRELWVVEPDHMHPRHNELASS